MPDNEMKQIKGTSEPKLSHHKTTIQILQRLEELLADSARINAENESLGAHRAASRFSS